MLQQIISGGQTGVDRAALDAALAVGLPIGGWCPKGRLAEDGVIPAHYPLQETESSAYPDRTARNITTADATLIIASGPLTGGTALTLQLARQQGKPVRLVDVADLPTAEDMHHWLAMQHVVVLNIAGPRASEIPDLYTPAYRWLCDWLLRK